MTLSSKHVPSSDSTPRPTCPVFNTSQRMDRYTYEVRDILARAEAVKARGLKLRFANIGDPIQLGGFHTPRHIKEAVSHAALDPRFEGYAPSAGDPELREALGARESLSPSRIFVTQGLTEGIQFLFQSLLDSGDNLLLPSPSYPIYMTYTHSLGGRENYYRTLPDGQPDLGHLASRIDARTKAIVVINPNNPTGAVYSRESLEGIIEIARQHRLPIIADEIYDLLSFGRAVHPMPTLADDVLIIRGNGLSKNFLYPGSRVGYLAVHGPEDDAEAAVAALTKLTNSRLSINWESQRGALAAYTQPITHLEATLLELQSRQEAMHAHLGALPGVRVSAPEAAFYTFPQIVGGPWADSRAFTYDLLDSTGIIAVSGSAFSPILDGIYLRLVSLAPVAETDEMMELMGAFMHERMAGHRNGS